MSMCDLTLWAADLTSCDRGVKTARTEHSLLLTTATTQRLLHQGNTRVKLYCCLEYIVCTYTVSCKYTVCIANRLATFTGGYTFKTKYG